jgi:hypothetical protein
MVLIDGTLIGCALARTGLSGDNSNLLYSFSCLFLPLFPFFSSSFFYSSFPDWQAIGCGWKAATANRRQPRLLQQSSNTP